MNIVGKQLTLRRQQSRENDIPVRAKKNDRIYTTTANSRLFTVTSYLICHENKKWLSTTSTIIVYNNGTRLESCIGGICNLTCLFTSTSSTLDDKLLITITNHHQRLVGSYTACVNRVPEYIDIHR